MEGKGLNTTQTGSAFSAPDDEMALQLEGVIGFNGACPGGMVLHPDDEHIIQPLGSTIVVRHVTDNKQYFLRENGHDNEVSALALSASGKYLASGQESHAGFKATIIIWNLETLEAVNRLVLHKGKVQALEFSPDENFLLSLGGSDDNQIVVWDVETGAAICGAMSANQTTCTVSWLEGSNTQFMTAGKNANARMWSFDARARKLIPSDISFGQARRHFLCSVSSPDAKQVYLGSATGDIFCIGVASKLFQGSGPQGKGNKNFSRGVTTIIRTRQVLPGNLIVGAGDGTVALISTKTMRIVRKKKFKGGITSLALNKDGDHFFVQTNKGNLYLVCLEDFDFEIRATSHYKSVQDVAFAKDLSVLFATCANDIRVWHAPDRKELLRIEVPNQTCQCISFAANGKAILSGWSDGKIRAFAPVSGKLLYAINDAHRGGVTAISCTSDSKRIVTGGFYGDVRIWNVGRQTQTMIASMKEHKQRVNSVMVNDDDTECVSAAADGSCIIWDLTKYTRVSCVFASTQFRSAVYSPDQCQLLTAGTDRKITYWDVVDANEIRIIEGSKSFEINSLDVTPDGDWVVSGGGIVKVWNYDDGECYYTGKGHSGRVASVRVSPNQTMAVSVGTEGGVFMWSLPGKCRGPEPAPAPAKVSKKKKKRGGRR